MFAINDGDVLEHKTFCWNGNQIGINVHHWFVANYTAPVSSTDCLGALGLSILSQLRLLVPATVIVAGATLQRIRPLPKTPTDSSIAGSGPGAFTGEILPREVSGIVSLYTDLTGRANRGRRYVAFPSEDASDDGHPNSAYIVLLNGLGARLSTPLGVSPAGGGNLTLMPVIWHKASSTWTLITSYIGRNKWAVQHRRGDYGKMNPNPFA